MAWELVMGQHSLSGPQISLPQVPGCPFPVQHSLCRNR